ncbi:MAG TPA: hypothetical protein VFZ64_17175 [Nocardioidaceae bacterium]
MTTPSNPVTPGTPGYTPTGYEAGQNDGMKDQAREAADTAADEGKHVAGVAKDEARSVLEDSKQQARTLLDEARAQVDEQSRGQRDRLVSTLRTFGDDVERMARGEQVSGGMAQDLARQVADRSREVSGRIDGREPSEILDEVRAFARRRPGTFLLGAVAAGVIAGRITRGAKDAGQNGSGTSGPYDDVRGTASGVPTAGTGHPETPAAYPEGSGIVEPATTMDRDLTPGTPGSPVGDTPWHDKPEGRRTV